MFSKQYLLVLLFSWLPVAFSSQSAVAFNLVYGSSDREAYRNYDYYRTAAGNDGYVMTRSIKQLSAPNPVSNATFWNLLTSSYSTGWNFQSAGGTPLYGTFSINTYRSCSPMSLCTIGARPAILPIVGTELDLDYQPNLERGDPDPNTGRVRWIQWVRSNHSIIPDAHGTSESVIDSDGNYPGTPYFYAPPDIGNKRSPYYFFDVPQRVDPDFQHDWIAQLFLAVESPQTQGSTTRTVTLYDGIEWGWLNRILSKKKQPVPNPVCPPVNNSTGGNCSPSPDDPPSSPPSGLCFNSIDQVYESCPPPSSARFALQVEESSPEITSVPEPTTTTALLAVGAWAGISWRKRKGEQKLNAGNAT
jgi:hypothetical protein